MQVATLHQRSQKIFTQTDETRKTRVCVICGSAATQYNHQNKDLDVLDI